MLHSVSGAGYAWFPQSSDIQVGDIVRWRWTTPELLDGVSYRVEQTTSPSATQYKQTGFRSGTEKSNNGMYTF